MPDLRAIVRELHAVPPAAFVAERAARAAQADDKVLSAQIKALRKPSAAAWAVNALARDRPDLVEEIIELGEQLRDAQSDTDGSRTRLLDRARRDLVAEAIAHAKELTLASGATLSASAATGVEDTLRAAMTDPDAGAAVQDGLLVTAISANPFEPVDLTEALALPTEGSRPRTRRTRPSGPTPLERKRREAAEAKVARARSRAKAATTELEERAAERQERLDELDELRGQAKAIMRGISRAEKAAQRADDAAAEAEQAEHAARQVLAEAEADLDRLP